LSDRESIIRDTTLRIGEFYNPIIKDFIKEYFPANPIIVISSYNEILKRPDIDILFWSLDKASAFARSHDGFSAVVPKNLGPPILMVYYMPRGADPWTDYINYWIGIKRIDGTTTELKDHWIDGNQPENGKKRWCLLHDVFHLM
jgi:hypothetical protein